MAQKREPKTKAAAVGGRDRLLYYAKQAGLPDTALTSIRGWVTEQFIGDEFAKLGQSGHTENRVPLRRVFVDLPVSEPYAGTAPNEGRSGFLQQFLPLPPMALISGGNRVLRESMPSQRRSWMTIQAP